ncbi:MAG: hypothetical protein AB8B87_09075 [Granulosicoccus sp.]
MNIESTPRVSVYRWFESDGMYMAIEEQSTTSLLDLELDPASGAEVQDLLDAVLLAGHDPLLQCLDAWSGHEFDWTPVRVAPTPGEGDVAIADTPGTARPLHKLTHVPRLTVSLSSQEGQKRSIFLAIPDKELADMPVFPEQWQPLVHLRRHAFQCEIALQLMQLDAHEWDKLQPGSMVLLERSFSERWPVKVHCAMDEIADEAFFGSIKASLLVEDNVVRLLEQNERNDKDNTDDYEISIRLQIPVLLNSLYISSAWQSGQNVMAALGEPLQGARVKILRYIGSDETLPTLYGSVVSIGRGYGVLLDALPDLPATHSD